MFSLLLVSFLPLWSVGSAAGIAIPEDIVYRSGAVPAGGNNLVIGALFPVHATGVYRSCGEFRITAIQTVESVVFAIRAINEDPNLLPNVSLAFDMRDTCLSVNYALQQSVDYIQTASNNCTGMEGLQVGPSAVLGASSSTITEAAANLLGLFQIPQISYASSAAVLSDKNRYDFFFRTSPSDLFQVEAIADIIVHFEWRYVLALHSDDLYGNGGIEALQQVLVSRNISNCITSPIALRDNPPNYVEAVNAMDRDWVRNASVVLLFGNEENAVGILNEIEARTRRDPSFSLQNLTWLALTCGVIVHL